MNSEFLTLSDEQLSRLGITFPEIVDGIEAAIAAEARGEIWTAPKSALIPGDGRYIMSTLSAGDRPGLTIVKSVMVSPGNPARGLNGIEGIITVQCSETGQLRALMQGGWVTAHRTAGLSAVAARKMANPESHAVAFLGCGVQARSHLETFANLFPLVRITAYGRGQANIDRLCSLARDMGLEAQACATPREAVADADIIVSSVTLAFDIAPFVDARWLKPGAFAAITDVAAPWVGAGMQAFGTVIIDDAGQEKTALKKMTDPSLVDGDIRGLVTGTVPSRFDPNKCSAFIFRGLAIGDFALAGLAYTRALEQSGGNSARW